MDTHASFEETKAALQSRYEPDSSPVHITHQETLREFGEFRWGPKRPGRQGSIGGSKRKAVGRSFRERTSRAISRFCRSSKLPKTIAEAITTMPRLLINALTWTRMPPSKKLTLQSHFESKNKRGLCTAKFASRTKRPSEDLASFGKDLKAWQSRPFRTYRRKQEKSCLLIVSWMNFMSRKSLSPFVINNQRLSPKQSLLLYRCIPSFQALPPDNPS